jgi:hypothetical protein
MSSIAVRIHVGTRLIHDGQLVEIVEVHPGRAGIDVVMRDVAKRVLIRGRLTEILDSPTTRVVSESKPELGDSALEPAGIVLAQLTGSERKQVAERAGHVREVLTGFRSGSQELALPGEPRAEYAHEIPLSRRYASKARELGAGQRTVERWVQNYQQHGEAGLVSSRYKHAAGVGGRVDPRWTETAVQVMVEHGDQSRPSRTMVIDRTNARVVSRFGEGVVAIPSRATAFRVLSELEDRYPTFRLSTKRNRDIADRPDQAYGKLRPTRPGEYLLMDTTGSMCSRSTRSLCGGCKRSSRSEWTGTRGV